MVVAVQSLSQLGGCQSCPGVAVRRLLLLSSCGWWVYMCRSSVVVDVGSLQYVRGCIVCPLVDAVAMRPMYVNSRCGMSLCLST